jgi:hypothetical protein
MAKRIKKAAVKPELRENWVHRNEEGESPPDIAKKDGYDVRTVRKYIELAKQEIEIKEARATVLRNAMEQHYEDMRKYAEMLNTQIFGTGRVELLKDAEFIEVSLRQHLPRSPIWTYLSKLPALDVEKEEQQHKVHAWIIQTVKVFPGLTQMVTVDQAELAHNIIEALKFQADGWAEGIDRMNLKEDLLSEPIGEGDVNLHYGAFHLIDRMNQQHGEEYKKIVWELLEDLESRLKKSEELLALEKTVNDIARVKRKLKEELAIIRLRRIVPGRCKYCPL